MFVHSPNQSRNKRFKLEGNLVERGSVWPLWGIY